VLHPLLYNLLEIFYFWKISKISKTMIFLYFDIFGNIMIFSNPGILRLENPTYTYWPLQRRVVLQWFY